MGRYIFQKNILRLIYAWVKMKIVSWKFSQNIYLINPSVQNRYYSFNSFTHGSNSLARSMGVIIQFLKSTHTHKQTRGSE